MKKFSNLVKTQFVMLLWEAFAVKKKNVDFICTWCACCERFCGSQMGLANLSSNRSANLPAKNYGKNESFHTAFRESKTYRVQCLSSLRRWEHCIQTSSGKAFLFIILNWSSEKFNMKALVFEILMQKFPFSYSLLNYKLLSF